MILAPLIPLGIGTSEGESLSSYVQRIAAADCTLPRPLLHRLVAWLAQEKQTAIGNWSRRTGVVHLVSNLNGFNHADHWLRILAQLTQRDDLRGLSTRPWDAPRTIQKIEAGRLNVLVTTLRRIRTAIGCRYDDLFGLK